ncbi:inositol monophosphatase 2 [Agrilus planipennis]|uniref:Inositol-1-monophosphatase n=1 Tax=Agrilus planipennis TaxID=224129 RepID=A0A1W4X6V0_AGRPL|nr:inositol monophosphatase 2 [Agrilus planipennis]
MFVLQSVSDRERQKRNHLIRASSMGNEDIKLYFETAIRLVKDAGKILLSAKKIHVEEKEPGDLVTEFDRKIEEVLINELKKKFPSHKFIGEEESFTKNKINDLTDDPTWIVDPIDGTSNFVRKIPITCISVGLVIKRERIIGIVYNPFHGELYTAIRGEGAYLNGQRIHTSKKEDISRACFNYELSLAKAEIYRAMYLTRLKYLIGEVEGIRSMGSAAMGLCYVARGYTDAYQCDGLYPWDAAAGVLIVEEAGGYVCEPTGMEFDLMKPDMLACATEKLARQFLKIEKKADEEWRLLLNDL